MPTEKETRVRVDGLSKRTATACGTGEWLPCEPVGLHRVGQVEHLDQLVGAEVVVAQEVPRAAHVSVPPVGAWAERTRVEDRRKRSEERVRLRVGEDQRRHQPDDVGGDRVDEESVCAGQPPRRPPRPVP